MARYSIKVCDKANVVRVEATINDPTQFRVLRVEDRHRVLCPMRKGVANLGRYYQVGRQANERYLDALAAAHDNRAGIAVLHRHTKPVTNRGRRHPRLSPISPDDLALFRAALAGEHAIVGFRNRDLARRLHPRPAADETEAHDDANEPAGSSPSCAAHGLVAKVPRRRLYRVTPYGQRFMAAALAVPDRTFPEAWAATA